MLKFFRRIRKTILADGATTKYMLYAAGEIALVVIGILIALQINNWNEWKKDRTTEREILAGIQMNLESNIDRLTTFREFLGDLDSSSEIVISMLNGSTKFHDSIINHFDFSLRQISNSQRTVSIVGYQALSNEGFGIIRNTRLKNEIIKLFEESYHDLENAIARVGQTYASVVDIQHEYFRRTPDTRLIPINPDELIGEVRIANWVQYIMSGRAYVIRYIDSSLIESENVINLIRDELSEQ